MVKISPANASAAGGVGSTPGLGRSPEGGNDNPLQYSYLENAMDRGAWQATGHGVTELGLTETVSMNTDRLQSHAAAFPLLATPLAHTENTFLTG